MTTEPESFDNVWTDLQRRLRPRQVVHNWTRLKGRYGDDFTVLEIRAEWLLIESPRAEHPVRVHRRDFEAVWVVWRKYLAGTVRRAELTLLTRCSKYVISMLHWREISTEGAA